jgi:hypothetical protein
VLWIQGPTKLWVAVDGYPTYEDCGRARTDTGACFPGTFDPRDQTAWILWASDTRGDVPMDGYPSNVACELARQEHFQKSAQKIAFSCYPSTFDLRRR